MISCSLKFLLLHFRMIDAVIRLHSFPHLLSGKALLIFFSSSYFLFLSPRIVEELVLGKAVGSFCCVRDPIETNIYRNNRAELSEGHWTTCRSLKIFLLSPNSQYLTSFLLRLVDEGYQAPPPIFLHFGEDALQLVREHENLQITGHICASIFNGMKLANLGLSCLITALKVIVDSPDC